MFALGIGVNGTVFAIADAMLFRDYPLVVPDERLVYRQERDPSEFHQYPPLVLALLPKYDGVVLASDTAASVVEGTTRTMNAIIRFPSKEAALGLYDDPDYQDAKRIRQASTRKVSMVLVEVSSAGTPPSLTAIIPST